MSKPFKHIDLHLFDANSGGGSNNDGTGAGAGDAGAGGQAGNGGQNGGNAGGGEQNKTFTQAEVDAIVASRLAREKEKYKDYDDLKKKAAEHDKRQQAEMNDLEKANARIKELEAKSTESEKKIAAFELEKLKLKVLKDQKMSLDLADRLHGTTEEELTADAKNLAKLLKDLGATGISGSIGSSSNPGGGGGGTADEVTRAKARAEERNKQNQGQTQSNFWK